MRNIITNFFLLVFIFCCGCKNSSSPTSVLNGNMIGKVVAYDTAGLNPDNSGVKISIDGTSYSTLSDSKGRWELDNIPPGTYNISFTKEGYAMEKMVAYRFVGNGTDYLFSQDIYQMIKINATIVTRPFDNGATYFSCKLFRFDPSESLNGLALILFGSDSSFNPLEPSSYRYSALGRNITLDSVTGYNIYIRVADLIAAGFHSGDKIYCADYGSNITAFVWDIQKQESIITPSYFDIATGNEVYTGFEGSRSEVKSFILP